MAARSRRSIAAAASGIRANGIRLPRSAVDAESMIDRRTITLLFQKQSHSHRDADDDHRAAHESASQLPGQLRSRVASGDARQSHDDRVAPDHGAQHSEVDRGDAVDADGQKIFQAVHLMKVRQADQSQSGEHEDAHSSAEVAAIQSDQKLKGEYE